MNKSVVALLSGVVFGFGLALSGMTDTRKVIGFLDLFGAWDGSLLLVMFSAVLVALLGFRIINNKLSAPVFDEQFFLPLKNTLDVRLVCGAIIFGIGWGIYGFCPGPALAMVPYSASALFFVVAMYLGMKLESLLFESQLAVARKERDG